MRFSTEEKIKLILEAIVIALVTLFMIYALFQFVDFLVTEVPEAFMESETIRVIVYSATQPPTLLANILLGVLTALVVVFMVAWRLSRRRRRFEMNHIISGLNVISQGNFDYRIEGVYSDDLLEIVDNIHMMVDSTVEAHEEERRLEESKEELVTNVSHDLRTPLTAIIGYLGLIETKQYKSTEELEKYSHIAYQKSLQMQSLVNDLFEYSKAKQGVSAYDLHSFDLVQLLEQLAAEFELESNEKEIELSVKANREEIYMKADPEKLVRAFTNIISNAFKYGADGDQIVIRIIANPANVSVRISNNGKPIPKKSLKNIFERFYRDEKSRPDGKGSGLGLAITKDIIEGHGGSISAKSANGWTHFDILLPLRTVMERSEED